MSASCTLLRILLRALRRSSSVSSGSYISSVLAIWIIEIYTAPVSPWVQTVHLPFCLQKNLASISLLMGRFSMLLNTFFRSEKLKLAVFYPNSFKIYPFKLSLEAKNAVLAAKSGRLIIIRLSKRRRTAESSVSGRFVAPIRVIRWPSSWSINYSSSVFTC